MKKFKPMLILLCILPICLAGGCSRNLGGAVPPGSAGAGIQASSWASQDGETTRVLFMHVNDIHSHLEEVPTSLTLGGTQTYLALGGMGRLAAKVNEVRAARPGSLLLCAGDSVQGTLYFPAYEGKAEAAFMNLLGFDAMVLGNHEFDKGPRFVKDFAAMLDCPLLGANAVLKGDRADLVKPYVIREAGGTSIAILGLITPETAEISNAGPETQFLDDQEAARRHVAALESRGINKIVLLSHLGYDRDVALAKAVSGIDVIIGGHSHTLLGDFSALGMSSSGPYPAVVLSPENEPVYIAQAWEWAKGLGMLDAQFNREGQVVKCSGDFILLAGDAFFQKDAAGNKQEAPPLAKRDILAEIAVNPGIETVAPDPRAMALLAQYSPGLEAFRQEVVARASEDLLHARLPGSAHAGSGVILKHGSMVAPLVAESLYWKCQSVGLRPDLSIQNAGGVRADIAAGPLTVAEAYTLLPFGNTAVLLELSGGEIRRTLEGAVARALDPAVASEAAFPYLGHGRYAIEKGKAPGSRVTLLEFKDAQGKWTPIQDKGVYRVAVNQFLSRGGDGYAALAEAKGMRLDTGFVDTAIFMEYAKARDPLSAPESTGVIMR